MTPPHAHERAEMAEHNENPGGKVRVKVGMAAVVTRADGTKEPVHIDGTPSPVLKELNFAELSSMIGEDGARKVFADHSQQGRVITD